MIRIQSLTNMDDNIYERQMRILDQRIISRSKVLVVGAGALGNEVVKNLIQLGVGKIYIVDFDYVVLSNLNRCIFFRRSDARKKIKKADAVARRAHEINPDCEIIPLNINAHDIPAEIYKEIDAIISCVDNLGTRLLLNIQAYTYNKPLIDGGIEEYTGFVQTVIPPSPPCIECSVSESELTRIWDRLSCTGQPENIPEPKLPYIPTTASIIAGLQSVEFVKIISTEKNSNKSQPVKPLHGKVLFLNTALNIIKIYSVDKKDGCNVCSS